MAGVYIHIPFCVKKCDYCDFVSVPEDGRLTGYVTALQTEIRTVAEQISLPAFDTVFFGGGTPSLLSGTQVEQIMDTLRRHCRIAPQAEISMEANPGTLLAKNLSGYIRAGINRMSVGLQSADDGLLRRIGRIHNYVQFEEAIELICDAGIKNINADVMAGLPGQTQESYFSTLNRLLTFPLTHISAYSLILEAGTPLFDRVQTVRDMLPDEDTVADMQEVGDTLLSEHGFLRYEISNYAKAGFRCRHNCNYWANGDYIGFGAAAHSSLEMNGRVRFSNVEGIDEYVKKALAGERPVKKSRRIDRREEMFECVMLGLRTLDGVSKKAFQKRFGVSIENQYHDAIAALAQNGWLTDDKEALKLNRRGLDLQNSALLLFM